MGKKQHQKDKMYLTSTEWIEIYGGKRASDMKGKSSFKKLPFYCCSLSLQPFENPMCTPEGVVFDLVQIVPYLKKYKLSPVTGEPLSAKDLIKLNFYRNSDGKYHCPVTYKVFNDNTYIVAIKSTGNVFAYDAVDRLNIKTKNLRDLLTDEVFTKADIITLQDPSHPEQFDLSTFHYVQNKLAVDTDEPKVHDSSYYLREINPETKSTLDILAREYKEPLKKAPQKKSTEEVSSHSKAHYSTGAVAHSFTSTAARPVTQNDTAIIDKDVVLYRQVKKKGYVRMHTSLGDLNLELHCNIVPKTCQNFITHCKNGYYDKTLFHRSIKNFMIQGGDPTGTGKGGQSIWGKPFSDEFKTSLTHTGRGVLSMANSGPDTNKSQFFITYRSCRHLDGKHTVFGRLVGGLEVLSAMEHTATDKHDRPQVEILISGCDVFVDPFEEAEQKLTEKKTDKEATKSISKDLASCSSAPVKVFREGVGKYIPKTSGVSHKRPNPETDAESTKKIKTQLSDFSSW